MREPDLTAEQLALQERLFEQIEVSKTDRKIVSDLARHAARQAVDSIQVVAKTVHDPRMVNVVLLIACMLVGEAAEQTVALRMAEVVDKMPPDVREAFEKIMHSDGAPKPIRDFDGNFA